MIRLRDADYWMFKGFSGAIRLLQRRGTEHKGTPISPGVVRQLEIVAQNLESAIKELGQLSTSEVTDIAQIDRQLVTGMAALSEMVLHRAQHSENQSVTAVDILQEDLQQLNRIIAGFRELNRRLG